MRAVYRRIILEKRDVISNLTEITGIGHRVVHGGATISGTVKIRPPSSR